MPNIEKWLSTNYSPHKREKKKNSWNRFGLKCWPWNPAKLLTFKNQSTRLSPSSDAYPFVLTFHYFLLKKLSFTPFFVCIYHVVNLRLHSLSFFPFFFLSPKNYLPASFSSSPFFLLPIGRATKRFALWFISVLGFPLYWVDFHLKIKFSHWFSWKLYVWYSDWLNFSHIEMGGFLFLLFFFTSMFHGICFFSVSCLFIWL